MQCPTPARRAVCGARNAYRPGRALLTAFFATSARCHNSTDSGRSSHYSNFDHLLGKSTESPPSTAIRKVPNAYDEQGDLYIGPQKSNIRHRGVRRLSIEPQLQGPIDYKPYKGKRSYVGCASWQSQILEVSNRDRDYAKRGQSEKATLLLRYRAQVDYEPVVIAPQDVKDESAPTAWPLPDFKSGKPVNACFNSEIRDFAAYMDATPEEKIARQAAIDEVMSFIEGELEWMDPVLTLEVFGSEKSGLAMPVSDIDIRIYNPSLSPEEQENPHRIMRDSMKRTMHSLQYRMKKRSGLFSAVTLRSGQNTLINFTHPRTGISFQIVAAKSSDAQEAVTRKFLAEMPGLKEVFTVVRTFFDVRRLISVYSGSLGSYSIFIMLVAALARPDPGRPNRDPASKLKRFFQYYDPTITDNNIDTTTRGVACYYPYTFKKHDQGQEYQLYSELAAKRGDTIRAGRWAIGQRSPILPDLLCIQDPANPYNDLGRKCRAIRHILATIVRTRSSMMHQFYKAASGKSDIDSLLTSIVGRPDILYAGKRRKLRAYGERVIKRLQKEDRRLEEEERLKKEEKSQEREVGAAGESEDQVEAESVASVDSHVEDGMSEVQRELESAASLDKHVEDGKSEIQRELESAASLYGDIESKKSEVQDTPESATSEDSHGKGKEDKI